MRNLMEMSEDLEKYWDFEELKRAALIEEIRIYSTSIDRAEFIKEVRSRFEQKNFSNISQVYEALSKTPKYWQTFFIEEYERAFKAAKLEDNAFDILQSIDEIGFIQERDPVFVGKIIGILKSHINHAKDGIKHRAIFLLGDWWEKQYESKFPYLMGDLRGKLNDKNWKIRYITELVLKDADELPMDYKRSFIDKIKIKMNNPFEL